ncbi:flagellar hook-associated protein FlgL [Thiosulfatimonas sediminis]|uniref:Flagellar hook-associated protein FlgL n=1 Tax=Thiosulfatimonas sediminis TaxID=2675054 RepID=A0A6F8PTR9_9GAMM|nr:flagellar hook-associated protein FlgL [Thiosulfatimonas sediminis]BBP45515.1 flagellar hook-associated protein FlgL [Thiosulfatimonas sediminis]
MRISTSQFHSQGVTSIQRHQEDILKTQLQLSTGKRVNAPGDDPVALSQINALKSTMSTIDQFAKNGDYAKSQLVLEETAIGDSISSIQRARELAIQMSNDTYNASNRAQAAAEVGQIIEQMRNMMNYSNSEGEKIFAGSSVNVEQAFVPDPRNPGYYAYVGSPQSDQTALTTATAVALDVQANYGSRFVQIGFDDNDYLEADDFGDASRVRITDNGSAVFKTDGNSVAVDGVFVTDGPVDNNILNTMVSLKNFLEAGERPPDELILDMDSALENLSFVRAEIGGRQNRIESQYDGGETFKLALEERRMNLEETDIVKGITDLTQQQNALQMAQQVFTRVSEMSLFNYLR